MKKVLFLMFLLFLIGLGAAGVKAQVRIGGNAAPNAAAVLDLNEAEGTTTGTKGLALPRVTLSSNTALLDGTTANIRGMLIYNTGGSLGAGVYYWDGAVWMLLVPMASYTMWTKVFLGTLAVPSLAPGGFARLTAAGLALGDLCVEHERGGLLVQADAPGTIIVTNTTNTQSVAWNILIECYRPSN